MMPWYFPWSDAIKKRACRYLLQRYMGQFLQEKLTLDQLSVDIYNGTGTIEELNLDVDTLNEMGEAYNLPVEFVDGYISSISVNIPWSSLLNESSYVEVHGLMVTVQPKQRTNSGSMFESMWNSMTTSMQLAEECLKQETDDRTGEVGQPFEGLELFAQTIESVLRRIKVRFLDTVIRIEHVPKESRLGVALEVRIKKVDYFDEAGMDESSRDHSSNVYEPAAFSVKKFYIENVMLYSDEFPCKARTFARSLSSNGSTESKNSEMYATAPVSPDLPPQHTEFEKNSSVGDKKSPSNTSMMPDPILVCKLSGRQEVRLTVKQNDVLPGPKVDVEFNFGSSTYFLSPRQVHILIELAYGLACPGIEDNSNVASRHLSTNKPMEPGDYKRVEQELQKQLNPQLLGKSLQHHQGWSSQSLDDSDEDFHPMAAHPMETSVGSDSCSVGPDLDSSMSSIGSGTVKAPSDTQINSPGNLGRIGLPSTNSPTFNKNVKRRSSKSKSLIQTLLEDPSAELTHYKLRVSSLTAILLHDDILTTTAESCGLVAQSSIDQMKELANKFFSDLHIYSLSRGMNNANDKTDIFAEICKLNHLRLVASPLIIEGKEKTSSSFRNISASLSCGNLEVVECLFDIKPFQNSSQALSVPDYSEILKFEKEESSFKPSWAEPCLRMKINHIQKDGISGSHPFNRPRTDVIINMGAFKSEVDISIVDRINALLNPQPLCGSFANPGSVLFTPSNLCNNQTYFHQAIEEGEISSDYKIDLLVNSPSVHLYIRFPIPDMRPHHDMDRMPWWKRNIRKDILTLKFKDASLHTSFGSRETSIEAELRCKECDGLYQESACDPPLSFLKVTTENKETLSEIEQGFDWPRLLVRINPIQPPLILEEEISEEPMDSMPASSIDTLVYQMFTTNKPDPSPFSSRKVLYESHPSQSDENNEKINKDPFAESEQMVMPGDKVEMARFIEKSTVNCRYVIELSLPKVDLFFPNKHFYEVIYNRINTDLCLWEPTAPKLMMQRNNHNLRFPPRLDLVGTQMQETMYQTFSVCKSGLHYESSSESEEESGIYFSVYDHKHKHKRQHQEPTSTRSAQNKIALNITTNQGQLTVFTPFRDSSGNVIPEHHGELHLQIRDGNCFVVMAYRGLSDVGHICLQANQAALFHKSMVPTSTDPVNLESISEAYTSYLDRTLYQSEAGTYTKLNSNVGTGGDSLDMFSMAVKISLDSNLNLKTFKVAIGIREATWLYKMSPVNQSWFSQFIDFFDVNDYPVSGYSPSAIVTELHLHLWSCALDYRPLYLPIKAVITIESFSISSNIAAQTSTSLLRFIAEDAALFISDNCSVSSVDLKKNYVCVVDMGYFDLSLRISDGKDPRHPHIDLRASNNIVHIRTCSDSCAALQNLLTYFANDGDLLDRTTQQKGESEMHEFSFQAVPQVSSDSESSVLSKAQAEQVHDLMVEAMQESRSNSLSSSDGEATVVDKKKQPAEVFLFPDESQPSQPQRTEVMKELGDSTLPILTEDGHYSADEEFCILEDDPGIGIRPKSGESVVRILVNEPIRLIENHFAVPIGKIDQLKAPKHFPPPVLRYTLQEMSVVWHMYGGQDFESTIKERKAKEKQVKLAAHESSSLHDSPSLGVTFSKGSPQEVHWMCGDNSPPSKASFHYANRNWQIQGGQGRLHNVLMELQMNKLRFQHEVYPENTEHAAHQILLIHEVEIRDRLASSQINKFLYQYSSEAMPRQSHANMVMIKALHVRPDPALPAQECSLKVSLLPLRLNIDQDALLFLCNFFSEVSQRDQISSDQMGDSKHNSKPSTPHPSPVMTIMKPSGLTPTEQQQFLITLEETPNMVQDLISPVQESYDFIPSQPIYFRSFIFSPDVPIRLDYHGKHVDMDQGALAGLIMGLGQLSCSELTLKRLTYRHGLLGCDKLLSYALGEWLQDIKKNQLPSLLGGVGPMHSLVQLVQGIRDLFWLPIEQYRKDGRIVRGLQRGANAFTTSTAMAALELTNRLVQTIQSAAETAYDMVSPGPSVKKLGIVSSSRRKRPSQPVDIREGMANAYNVVKEGLGDTARTLVKVASEEHEQKGLSGAVGGVLRQIPQSVVKPIILATEATSNVLGGMRHQLAPDTRREAAEKWRSEEPCT